MAVCPHCGKEISEAPEPLNFTEKQIARFWSKVKKEEGCWPCSATPSGWYSRIQMGGRSILGHVASWIIHNGQIPEGMKVCHKCDNTRCVRPDHLFLGTHSENMKDMVRKGRNKPQRGALNHFSKLTEPDVVYIRESLASKTETINSLATKFQTSFQGIYQVARGNAWGHVGGPSIGIKPKRLLTPEEVQEMRELWDTGLYTQAQLAARFGLPHQATVSKIVRGLKHKSCLPT